MRLRKIELNGIRICLALCLQILASPTQAQWVTGTALVSQEKQWQSCTGGYYTGPREGRRNYSNDKYLWVATPEFAKRFCLPGHMVSAELKGADAIAFRMVDGADNDRCGVDDDGAVHCSENSKARLEIYLPQSLNLPAANPGVRFFEGGRTTSDWYLSEKERGTRAQAFRKGQYQIPFGQIPRFSNPYAHPDPGYRFGLIYAHEGKGRWPVSSLWEVGFRGDWVQGIDMLILEEQLGIRFAWELDHFKAEKLMPGSKNGQYLIVMDRRDSQTDNRRESQRRIPDDYSHVIYLPHHFAMLVREATMRQGGNWLDVVKTLQQR